jgi:hypothetical protein
MIADFLRARFAAKKQDAMRYPADPADPANATDRLANS